MLTNHSVKSGWSHGENTWWGDSVQTSSKNGGLEEVGDIEFVLGNALREKELIDSFDFLSWLLFACLAGLKFLLLSLLFLLPFEGFLRFGSYLFFRGGLCGKQSFVK